MPRFQMYVNSDVNVLSFEGNFVLLHTGTVLNCECILFLALTKIQTNYYRTNFFLLFSRSTAKPFHRSNDKEGSRSIAERFVVVIRTKPSPAHVLCSVVTFPVANIVTDHIQKSVIFIVIHYLFHLHLYFVYLEK